MSPICVFFIYFLLDRIFSARQKQDLTISERVKDRPSKNKFFLMSRNFISCIMISKIGVKMNLRIIMKNHAADSKIRSPEKIDFRADGTHESHPTALELIWNRLEKSF